MIHSSLWMASQCGVEFYHPIILVPNKSSAKLNYLKMKSQPKSQLVPISTAVIYTSNTVLFNFHYHYILYFLPILKSTYPSPPLSNNILVALLVVLLLVVFVLVDATLSPLEHAPEKNQYYYLKQTYSCFSLYNF